MIVLMPVSNPIHQLVREPTATPTATTPPSAAAKPSNPFIITPIRISIQVKGVFSIDKEAPSNEGAFLVSATPPIGMVIGGGVLGCFNLYGIRDFSHYGVPRPSTSPPEVCDDAC